MPKPTTRLWTHVAAHRVRLAVSDASEPAREKAEAAAIAVATAREYPWAVEREGGGLSFYPGPTMHVGGAALRLRLGSLRSEVRRAATLALRATGYTVRRG